MTVNEKLPAGFELRVDTLSVDDPDWLIEAELKLAVAPVGAPATLRDTVPLKPFSAVTEIVKLVLPPAVTDCDAGVADIEKSGAPVFTGCQSAGTFGGSQPTWEVWD